MRKKLSLYKRTFALLVVIVMAACCACDAEKVSSRSVSDLGTPSTAAGTVKKPESISWISHDGLYPEDGQTLWDSEFERLTGIELRHRFISGPEYDQRIALYAEAGTLPDVFDLGYTYYPEFAANHTLADLTELVHASGLYDQVDTALWEQVTLDGKIYGVPREYPQARGTYVRKDWLDRLDMEVPRTYEEFITMLTRFRDEIEECQIPYVAPDVVSCAYLPEFYQGMQTEIIPVDGVWVDGMQQPGMAAALSNLQAAYADGLLGRDVVTNTTAACRDAWMTGTVGAFCYWAGNWGQQLAEGLKRNVPDAEIICIPPIEGAVYLFSRPTVHVINAELSDEQIAQVFQYFIAYMHDGGEGQRLFEFGVEGVHWQQEGQHIRMLPQLSNPSQRITKAYVLPSSRITPLRYTPILEHPDFYTTSIEIVESVAHPQYYQPASPTYTRIADTLTATRNDLIAQIVTGGLTVEEGLATYKEAADALGLNDALAEMNQSK